MSRARPDTLMTDSTLTRDDLSQWLDRVSRTFALTIRMLQEPFRTYASAAYLLCRSLDTIEDSENLRTEIKCAYLRDFCIRVAENPGSPTDPLRLLFPGPTTWEERLTNHEPAILAMVRSFPSPIRDIVLHYAVEMAEGMVMFLERQNENGFLHFDTDEQLDQYCYFVAGTVGLMLNEMFAAISGTDLSAKRETAVELGIGLQLTNIVKDMRKDRLRNVNYCPQGRNPHWQGQASTLEGNDALWEIRSLASATISHLTGGKEYLLDLDSNFKQYKYFCVTNYLMAWKTLEASLRDSLQAADPVGSKISRFSVYFTLAESHGCVVSNRYLNWRIRQLRARCVQLVRNTPSAHPLPHPAGV
jgi:farnesyl-diphosphate farnesyltransferase